jgi:hypothetical protein
MYPKHSDKHRDKHSGARTRKEQYLMDWQLELHNQYHRELIEEAAELRLAREILQDKAEARGSYNPALSWVGERFATLTRALRAREEDAHSAN